MFLSFVAPSGEAASLDVTRIQDASSFSEAISAAMPSSVPVGTRVVGFMDAEGHALLPTLVLKQPSNFADQRLLLILDTASRGSRSAVATDTKEESKSAPPARRSSRQSESSGSDRWIEFEMFPGDDVGLTFSRRAVLDLHKLVRKTGLGSMPFATVASAFAAQSENGFLSKRGFDLAVRSLVPRTRLSKDDRRHLSLILNGIFFLFDRRVGASHSEAESPDSTEHTVVLSEFVAGFSVFCAGNKSEKLSEAFHIFDLDGDGQCSRREVWRFLRSFLTALFAVSSSRMPGESDKLRRNLHDLIDDTAVEATNLVFSDAGAQSSGGAQKRVSFDAFGAWYNGGGYLLLPWMELLDLRKWPTEESAGAGAVTDTVADADSLDGAAAAGASDDVAAEANATDDYQSGQPLLTFKLAENCPSLDLAAADVSRFQDLLSVSGIASIRPKSLVKALVDAETNGMLSLARFREVMRSILPDSVLDNRFSQLSEHTVESALTAIFGAFDVFGGEVDTNDFVSGFLLLASGSKSDKLSLAFNLFDVAQSKYLSRRSVWRYLRSFLTALACLSSECAFMEQDAVQTMVDSGAIEMAANVFLHAEHDREDSISFDEFGRWYNTGGYKVAPWLELLDHSKWLGAESATGAAAAAAAAASAQPTTAAPSSSSASTEDPVLITFDLSSAGDKLQLTAKDCQNMRTMQQLTRLEHQDPEYMHTLFNTRTSDGVLDKDGFDHCIRQLVPGSDLSEEDKTYLTFQLSVLFYAFVGGDSSYIVPYDEFSAGMSLLASGSKSDKLSLGFRLFDHDEDGFVDRRQMFAFLRGFLTVLVAMQGQYVAMDPVGVRSMINGAVVHATNEMFNGATLSRRGLISYEEFGMWYNQGGYLTVPWLELLDLRKWPNPDADSAPAPASADAPPAAPRNDVLYRFKLSNTRTLDLSVSDCQRLRTFLDSTGLDSCPPNLIDAAFADLGEADGAVSMAQFVEGLESSISRVPTPETSTVAASVVQSIYQGFSTLSDLRTGNTSRSAPQGAAPDVVELTVGMLVLSSGTKSEKLSVAFNLLDDDGDGLLSKLQMWQYIRAFLAMLVSLTSSNPAEAVRGVVDRAALDLTQSIFGNAELSPEGLISHSEFGRWYNEGGFEAMPWLELLDLSKWPAGANDAFTGGAAAAPRESAAAPPAQSARAPPPPRVAAPSASSPSDREVFEFSLSERSQQGLVITQGDCNHLHRLVRLSGLRRVDPSALANVFVDAAESSGPLTRSAFEDVVTDMIDLSACSDEEAAFVESSLSAVFTAFTKSDTPNARDVDAVDPIEFAVGFSLLTAGGKSDKLSLAFRLFDADDNGFLTKVDMWRHLRALLTMLIHLSSRTSEQLEGSLAARAAMDALLLIFANAQSSEAQITYEEFGVWYNSGGYQQLPWLELLDLSKWPADDAAEPVAARSAVVPAATSPSEATPTLDAAPSRAEADPPLIQFALGSSGETISISAGDIRSLQRLINLSRFSRVEADHLHALFDSEATAGQLSKDAFDRCIARSIDIDALSEHNALYVRHTLDTIFRAFDSNGDGVVDEAEFAAGFSILASGSKSDKLSMAFRLFDTDGDDYITQLELFRYLKGFLTVLVSLSRRSSNIDLVDSKVTNAAMELTEEIFSSADMDKDSRLSYEEFGQWYNRGGHNVLPWLELLDLKKWSNVADAAAASSSSSSSAAAGATAGTAGDSSGAGQGASAPAEQFDIISITESDLTHLDRLLGSSRLDDVAPSRVYELFAQYSDEDGRLSKASFDAVIRELIPGDGLSSEDKSFLSFALSNVFFAFDQNSDHAVDAHEFAAGFSLLASGSKSDKLSLAFRLFDEDGDGFISRAELFRYLTGFLTVLCALQRCYHGQLPASAHSIIADHAADMTGRIILHADDNGDGRISYEEFGQWYNDGGFEVIPWLELLDLRKWKAAATAAEDDAPADADAEADGSGSDADMLFQFPLQEGGPQLVIRREDAANLSRMVRTSRLSQLDPEFLHSKFTRHAQAGSLDKDSFDAVIREIVPGDGLTSQERSFLSFALSNVFFAFDRDANGAVDFAEFTAGFSLLASGSKSDKLSLAFRLFDEDDDGFISRTEMWRYLRAFLTFLAALQREGPNRLPADELNSLLASSAVDMTSLIFREADHNGDGRISYEEFGRWYNEGGFEVIPWLELLDLSKWPVDTSADDDDDGDDDDDDDDEEIDGDDEDADDDDDDDEGEGVHMDAPPSAVFKFNLSADGSTHLMLTYADCKRFQRALRGTTITETAAEDVVSAFAASAADGRISRSQFRRVCSELSPDSEDNATRLFSNIYSAFETDQGADSRALSAGFLVLAGGTKSEKLSLAFFRIFDDDEDEFLTTTQLRDYLRSFLTVLASLSLAFRQLPSSELRSLVTRAVNPVVEAIVGSSNPRNISYAEFGRWYNETGHGLIPWLELLDTKKWPDVLDDGDEYDDSSDESYTSRDAAEDEGEEAPTPAGPDADAHDDDGVFVFHLHDSWSPVKLTVEDIENVLTVVNLSGLSNITPQQISDVIAPQGASSAPVSKKAFYKAVRTLIPGKGLSTDQQKYLTRHLSKVFKAFSFGSDECPAVMLASGFSLLAAGSKSEKLSHAFSLFDADDDGSLTEPQIAAFVFSFLAALVAVAQHDSDSSSDDLNEMLSSAASDIAANVLKDCGQDGSISYPDFGTWYNGGGFKQIPWLELLDLSKWSR